jgi:NAD(P)H-flavin reductase
MIHPMTPRWYKIRRLRRETKDTFTLDLDPVETNGCTFAPGQFNMVYLYGLGEVPLSISGDASKPRVLTHTVRAVGAVTNAMQRLRRGEIIGIRGPFGSSWPVNEAGGMDVAVIAGGIGLAPLRPAIYYLLANREQYGRIALLYGARTPDDILYRQELLLWRGRFDIDVHVTVDRAPTNWRGNVGVVTKLIAKTSLEWMSTVAMVCGPEIMMRFTAMELQQRGVPPDQIYISMERNMKCAIGVCGHCQYGPLFVCKDGPVFQFTKVRELLYRREV